MRHPLTVRLSDEALKLVEDRSLAEERSMSQIVERLILAKREVPGSAVDSGSRADVAPKSAPPAEPPKAPPKTKPAPVLPPPNIDAAQTVLEAKEAVERSRQPGVLRREVPSPPWKADQPPPIPAALDRRKK